MFFRILFSGLARTDNGSGMKCQDIRQVMKFKRTKADFLKMYRPMLLHATTGKYLAT